MRNMINSLLTAKMICNFEAMQKLIKEFGLVLLVFLSIPSLCQTGIDSLSTKEVKSIFDIERSSIDNVIEIDSSETITQPVIETNVVSTIPSIDNPENNPFDVNHIPIRQNQLSGSEITKTQEKPKDFLNRHFTLWVTLLLTGLLSIVLANKSNILEKVIRSIGSENQIQIFSKEEMGGHSLNMLLLFLIYILGISLFILFNFNIGETDKPLFYFLKISGATLLVYFIKYLIINSVTAVYPKTKGILNLYFFVSLISLILVGLVLIVFNLVQNYIPSASNFSYYAIIICILISLLFRYSRTFISGSNIIIGNLFYFLLYLCTCEIAPAILLYTFIQHNFVQ